MTGWTGRVRHWDYDDITLPPLPSAARFEEGAHNMAGIAALGASLALFNGSRDDGKSGGGSKR